jgi:hypothetical protein
MITFKLHNREDISLRIKWLNNIKATQFAVDDPTHITTTEEQTKWFDSYEQEFTNNRKFFLPLLMMITPLVLWVYQILIRISKLLKYLF